MNTAVYYVFLYMHSCLTNDFCSDKIKNDETFRGEILKIWDGTFGAGGENAGNSNGVTPPRELFEKPWRSTPDDLKGKMKTSFLEVREYWGKLPESHFSGGIEDKVARMVITLAIFNGSAKSIPGYRHLLNDKECTNAKNQIHMECLAGFGQDLGVEEFKVDFGKVSTTPGIHVTLINGHFIPYFVREKSIYFIDMEYVIPTPVLESPALKGYEKFFLNYKINQLGEECGLHSIMSVLYTRIVEINPYFVWYKELVPEIDYKSLGKMRHWLKDNGIDHTALLRAQEFVSYKIF